MNKFLIVHADDFGLSPGISQGIIGAWKNGIVTSTSVIVESIYLNHSQKLIQQHLNFDWGLHVVISQVQPSPKTIIFETEQQFKIFKQKFGFSPSHLDFHQGFKFDAQIYFAILMWTQKHHLSFRYDRQHHLEIEFYGMKNGQVDKTAIGVDSLAEIIDNLPTGVTELVCHPGQTSTRLTDVYRLPRNTELKTLTAPKIKNQLRNNQVKLINYQEYKPLIKQLNESQT